jgi:hypothetical protein
MSVTVHFKDTSTNKITSLEYEMGAVIPELGDYIVSPFNADRIALVISGNRRRQKKSLLGSLRGVASQLGMSSVGNGVSALDSTAS